MATESPSTAKDELQPASINEAVHDDDGASSADSIDDKSLQQYLYKNASFNSSLPYMVSPVIDLELLSSPSSPKELDKLQSALASWGCFQILNHGISSSLLDDMREVTKEFFSLPQEEKRKYETPLSDYEGYGNRKFVVKNQLIDWTDTLYLLTHPIDKRRLQLWPQSLREKLDEYASKSRGILELVLKAMARSLSIDDELFKKQFGQGRLSAKYSYYPKCPYPDRILGIKPHSDGSVLTILLQDKTVEGLQILKDEQWFKVPIIPNALVINAGDQLEIMSNGIFRSPQHRVVTSAQEERISLAMFCLPDDEIEIGPVKELTEDRPQMYKRVKMYRAASLQYYQLGQNPLSAFRI